MLINEDPFLIILPNVLLVESTIEISHPTVRLQVIFAAPITASVDEKFVIVPFVIITSVNDAPMSDKLVIIASLTERTPLTD